MGGGRRRQRIHRRQRRRGAGFGPTDTTLSALWTAPVSRTGGGPERGRRGRPAASCWPSATPTTWSGPVGSGRVRASPARPMWSPGSSTSDRSTGGPPRPSGPRPPQQLGFLPGRPRAPTSPSAASAFDEVGGFAEALHVGEDIDLCWRLQLRGFRFAVATGAVVAKRERPGFAPGLPARGRPTGSVRRCSTGATAPPGLGPIWAVRPGRGSGCSPGRPCSSPGPTAQPVGPRRRHAHRQAARLDRASGCSSPEPSSGTPRPSVHRLGQFTSQSAPT